MDCSRTSSLLVYASGCSRNAWAVGTAQTLAIEFVAGGRIWVMTLYRTPSMIGWGISLCLSQDSSPAHLLAAVLVIKVHGGEFSCANPPQDERIRLRARHNRKGHMLAPTNDICQALLEIK